MKDLFVRRVYSSYGVSIVVELDFVKKTVSLVEKDGSNKKWVFAERTPEYLNAWRNILRAMEYAIEQAQTEMQAVDEQESKDLALMYMQLDQALKKGLATPLKKKDSKGEN